MLLALFPDMEMFWYLPALVAAISLVYSGTRFEQPATILLYSIRWGIYILAFLAATWLFVFLLGTGSYYVVPFALLGLGVFLFGGGKSKPKNAAP
ncbi:hypothetical protein K2X85_10780 [bacterium]|nr:hypothetical protein [bacterium]